MKIALKNITALFICIFFSLAFSTNLYAQSRGNFTFKVTGTVVNADKGDVLPGVRIAYEDLASAMTKEDGKFSITLPSGSVNLVVSCPGYVSKVISVKGRNEITIQLHADGFISVFDPVITPQGENLPINISNAWSANSQSNILSTSAVVNDLLQGKFSGVNLIKHSGAPASNANMYIRGLNTMNAGIQPLFIIDGIPYENSIYSTALTGNYFSNPLASIDPKDIESITVLKDGTSQYGVKGANGVVLISTIRPSDMETRINFHAHTGFNFSPVQYPMLNSGDHKLLLFDVLQSQGMTGSQIMALPYMNEQKPVLEKWGYEGNVDYYRYNNETNWQNELYKPNMNQNYYLNIFGGDNVAIYALSIGYMDQKSSMDNVDFSRFNTRFNSEVKLTNKFTMKTNMSFIYADRNLMDEGAIDRNPIYSALIKAPFMAAHVYDESGAVSPLVEEYDIFGNSNPYALIQTSSRTTSQIRFSGNFDANYKLNNHFDFNAKIAVNYNKENEKAYFPNRGVYFDTLAVGAVKNQTEHRIDRLFTLYGEGLVKYKNTFALEHKLNAVLGVRYQNNKSEDDWGKISNTGSDNFTSVSYGDPLYRVLGGQIANWNWMSIFGNVDYAFRHKYFLNYSMSADASSRYGKNASSFYVYPSLSGAWLISGEEFMKDTELFDILKLRAGYGISGNDDIGNYNGRQYYIPQNLLGHYGIVRGNLVDFNLKPETSVKMNVGLDAAFLNERISFSIDVYQNKIKDMLVRKPMGRETGFPYSLTNAGEMQNTGIDLSINSRILNGPVKWDLGLVVSSYKNKVTNLYGEEYITSISGADILTKEGEALGVFYGYKTNGVYSTQQEAEDAGLKIKKGNQIIPFEAGDVRFVNTDSSNDFIDENDKVIIGNPNPDLYGSISSNLNYKGWNLDVFLTYSLGNDIYNYTRSQLENMSSYNNQTQAVKNRWKTEGDITNMPRANYGDPKGNSRFSDRWIEDGSYMKLKLVTLSYNIPIDWKYVRNCTLYATGENLLTFTKYKGADPEFALGQSPLYNGIDATFIPHSRTLSLGVKLDL